MTWGEWQIVDVGYGRSKDRSTYLKKPGRNRIRVRLFVRTDSDAGVKEEKLEGSVGGEGECGDEVEVLLVREIRSLDILSAREMPGVEVGNGDEDLRWSSLLTVCQRRLELSETEETKHLEMVDCDEDIWRLHLILFWYTSPGYAQVWNKWRRWIGQAARWSMFTALITMDMFVCVCLCAVFLA